MASDGHKRLRGESATLCYGCFPYNATRGQVAITNRALEAIRATETDPEYLKFAKFMKINPLAFRGDFNPTKAEGWIETLEGTFSVLACTGL